MNPDKIDVLLLGGTFEARRLATALNEQFPGLTIVASYAGSVQDLPDLPVPMRIGGFGGIDGLTNYLETHNVRLVIDATHPFASQMSHHAAAAAHFTSRPLIRLERPEWQPQEGDDWQNAADMPAAADSLHSGSRVFLAAGRKEIERFVHRHDIFALTRMIEPPDIPLPDHWHLELARPSQSVQDEIQLMQRHYISTLVCKNSGGTRSFAKLEAARALKLPVIMVQRPKLPKSDVYGSVNLIVSQTEHRLRQVPR